MYSGWSFLLFEFSGTDVSRARIVVLVASFALSVSRYLFACF